MAAIEAVTALLHQYTSGTIIEDLPGGQRCRTYLPEDAELPPALREIETRLGQLPAELLEEGAVTIGHGWIEEEDWAHAWKAYWKAVRIGKRLVVKPTWQPWPPEEDPQAARLDDLLIELDPGMAFGTGSHPTTRLCLEAVEQHVRPGMRVVDLGCGTGLLTIAALRLGAAEVLALDNDPLATEAATANCRRNAVEGCHVRLQAGLDEVPGQWDLIVANISPEVIKAQTPLVKDRLVPGGVFICSGFYEGWDEEIAELIRREGLEYLAERTEELWGCLHARKP